MAFFGYEIVVRSTTRVWLTADGEMIYQCNRTETDLSELADTILELACEDKKIKRGDFEKIDSKHPKKTERALAYHDNFVKTIVDAFAI